MSTLWLVVTRRCQLACGWCYQAAHDANPHVGPLLPGTTGFMPREVADAGMRWALDWPNVKAPLRVNLYGGEPLLAFNLLRDIVPEWNVHFARERGRTINWGITTNGVLLAPPVREFLDRYGIGVLLSLDGPKRIHDTSRVRHDGRGSWDQIAPEELVRWRPKNGLEIAWTVTPAHPLLPEDLDEVLALGFKRVNFNLDWLVPWDAEARSWLAYFFRHVGRLALQGELLTNWKGKLERAMLTDEKMEQPCGTGTGMLALTPEGYLYPSQEMAFTVFQPGRAAGTAEHYRVGNVFSDPVIDRARLADVSGITTADMQLPTDPATGVKYDCSNCIAKSDSIGGCHCRYVGQRHEDPSYRFDVPLGYCQSNVAAHTGMLQAAAIERWVRPVTWKAPVTPTARPLPGWGR